MSEERVDEALRALCRADGQVEPGPGAEVRALLAFRRQHRKRRIYRLASIGSIAAAVIALLVAVRAPAPKPAPVIARAIPAPAPQVRPVAAAVRKPAVKPPQREEVVTPFFPLMPSAPPFESGLLVRVTVQASAMRSVGIPVADEHLTDPVLAEVLVGQDDLARAIRFVSYQ